MGRRLWTFISLLLFQQASSALSPSSHLNKSLHALIVTVRYNEPLPTSTEPLTLLSYPHLIYNRGKDQFPSEYKTIVELDNVGKEFFIFLKYLHDHYHQLPDFIIFGRYKQFMSHNVCKNLESIMMTTSTLAKENDGFAYLGEGCGLEMKISDEFSDATAHITHFLGPEYVVKHPKYIKGSFFVVSREAVLRNSQQFYQELARKFASSDYSLHHDVPAMVDKLWPLIFKSQCLSGEEFHCIYHPK